MTASVMSPSPTSPTPTSPGTKRKSWFSLHLRPKAKAEAAPTNAPPAALKGESGDTQNLQDSEHRLRPIQFAPNRIATLYVTPSERNLYLAAMEQLDSNPDPLPLWTDPAPTLPSLPITAAPLDVARQPNGHARSQSSPHPLTTRPLSPKLVMSPGQPFPGTGLQIRDEFRTANNFEHRSDRHALLSLAPDSFMRFTGFPPATLIAVEQTLRGHWPKGIVVVNKTVYELRKVPMDTDSFTWRVFLAGNVWKCKGSQELGSVRLMVALLTTLAFHGWTMVENTQAGHMENVSHNLLFAHSPEVEARPPAFFAVSIPLPDRLSLISAPEKITPALLAAIRESIVANSRYSHSPPTQNAPGRRGIRASIDGARNVTWGGGGDGLAKGVKLEGWVHPGVYRFWIAGMRRWLGGTVKQGRIDKIHPHLVLSLMNNLAATQVDLVASIPFLPRKKGRDVFYFCTTPESGLTCLDSWKPEQTVHDPTANIFGPPPANQPIRVTSARPSTATSSYEMVSPMASQPNSAGPPSPVKRNAGFSPTPGGDATPRVFPWTSILDEGPPDDPRSKKASQGSTVSAPPPSAMPKATTTPTGSSAGSTPRQRNVLLKKNSARRKNVGQAAAVKVAVASTASQPVQQPLQQPVQPIEPLEGGIPPGRSLQQLPLDWPLVQPPSDSGHLGLSTHEPNHSPVPEHHDEHGHKEGHEFSGNHLGLVPPPAPIALPQPATDRFEPQGGAVYPNAAPPPTWHNRDRFAADRQSSTSSLHSGESVYEDTTEYTPPTSVRLPVARQAIPSPLVEHPATNSHTTPGQPKGLLVPDSSSEDHSLEQSIENAHTGDSPPLDSMIREASSPRRAGSAMVEAGSHLGINSLHGSVGYFASQSVLNYVPGDAEGRPVDFMPPLPNGLGGSVPPPQNQHGPAQAHTKEGHHTVTQTHDKTQTDQTQTQIQGPKSESSDLGSVQGDKEQRGSTPDRAGSSRTRMSLNRRPA